MSEPVFVDGVVVGYSEKGVFWQRITERHIFRQYNAKGIDANLFERLRRVCHTWRLVFRDTKQVLSVPFDKIEVVGIKTDTGAGRQILVKLEDFNEEQVAMQKRLL